MKNKDANKSNKTNKRKTDNAIANEDSASKQSH